MEPGQFYEMEYPRSGDNSGVRQWSFNGRQPEEACFMLPAVAHTHGERCAHNGDGNNHKQVCKRAPDRDTT